MRRRRVGAERTTRSVRVRGSVGVGGASVERGELACESGGVSSSVGR